MKCPNIQRYGYILSIHHREIRSVEIILNIAQHRVVSDELSLQILLWFSTSRNNRRGWMRK